MKHLTDKIELIIMGGTFLSYPKKFQEEFVKGCYDALNRKKSKSIEEAKKINENAKYRCTNLSIETRPDFCSPDQIKNMLYYGATRIEMGVQAIDDEIYRKVKRGHSVKDVIDATERLKKAGFHIGYHLMPGIPGSNPKKDFQMFKELFSSSKFKPDQIKFYPCQVLKGSGLESPYYNKEYLPYTKEEAKKLLIKMIKQTPRYCRIMRIMREIPPFYLVAGIKNIDLRKEIEEEIRDKKTKIKEIRFREVGFALRDKREINKELKIKITKYSASEGDEYFIESVNKDELIFGLLRLRIEKDGEMPAIIRELHVYGPTAKIGETSDGKIQHKGIGKELLETAEKIAKRKIKILSGVGVREYYRKLGYTLDKEGIYMEKIL